MHIDGVTASLTAAQNGEKWPGEKRSEAKGKAGWKREHGGHEEKEDENLSFYNVIYNKLIGGLRVAHHFITLLIRWILGNFDKLI